MSGPYGGEVDRLGKGGAASGSLKGGCKNRGTSMVVAEPRVDGCCELYLECREFSVVLSCRPAVGARCGLNRSQHHRIARPQECKVVDCNRNPEGLLWPTYLIGVI